MQYDMTLSLSLSLSLTHTPTSIIVVISIIMGSAATVFIARTRRFPHVDTGGRSVGTLRYGVIHSDPTTIQLKTITVLLSLVIVRTISRLSLTQGHPCSTQQHP